MHKKSFSPSLLRIGALFGVLLITLLSILPTVVSAQTSVEFNRWDARITARSGSDQLQIVESQEINITGGTLSRGTREWANPVQIQSVSIVGSAGSEPAILSAGDGSRAGTYAVSQNGSRSTLSYTLPAPQNAGTTITVQISYTGTSTTAGLVDWAVVPDQHNFAIRSSTATITFPQGEVPDPGLVRPSRTDASVQANGNVITVQVNNIAANEEFGLQIPYGAGVGASGSGGNPNPGVVPNNPAPGQPGQPAGTPADSGPGIGTIVIILIVLAVLFLGGGGGLLRGLLGGGLGSSGLGGLGGTPRGGSGIPGLGNLFGSSTRRNSNLTPGTRQSDVEEPTIQRGFTQSTDQDRNIGKVGNDKDSSGGASFS